MRFIAECVFDGLSQWLMSDRQTIGKLDAQYGEFLWKTFHHAAAQMKAAGHQQQAASGKQHGKKLPTRMTCDW
ncbi:MAG: hypothetical protein AAB329_02970 [Pseudomonadota bacterium]